MMRKADLLRRVEALRRHDGLFRNKMFVRLDDVRELVESLDVPAKECEMVAVIIPAKTVVHIGGIPVALAVDTIVETAYGNMQFLTGYHYATMPDPEAVAITTPQVSSEADASA